MYLNRRFSQEYFDDGVFAYMYSQLVNYTKEYNEFFYFTIKIYVCLYYASHG